MCLLLLVCCCSALRCLPALSRSRSRFAFHAREQEALQRRIAPASTAAPRALCACLRSHVRMLDLRSLDLSTRARSPHSRPLKARKQPSRSPPPPPPLQPCRTPLFPWTPTARRRSRHLPSPSRRRHLPRLPPLPPPPQLRAPRRPRQTKLKRRRPLHPLLPAQPLPPPPPPPRLARSPSTQRPSGRACTPSMNRGRKEASRGDPCRLVSSSTAQPSKRQPLRSLFQLLFRRRALAHSLVSCAARVCALYLAGAPATAPATGPAVDSIVLIIGPSGGQQRPETAGAGGTKKREQRIEQRHHSIALSPSFCCDLSCVR